MRPRKIMKVLIGSLLLAWVVLPALPLAAAPSAEEAILGRLEDRLAEEMELKLAGKLGENRSALLEGLKPLEREERRLVAEQNRDRLALYRIIADRIGVPLNQVQASRAEDIREKSPDGIWLQSSSGEWYRK